MSTDKALAEEEIVRLYDKCCNISVFFKMCNQHQKMADEIQIGDFDGLIVHTSMGFARYNFIDALSRIMKMAVAVMPGARKKPEKVFLSISETAGLYLDKPVAACKILRGQKSFNKVVKGWCYKIHLCVLEKTT